MKDIQGIKETVDLHTQLAGKNRFEMLLFKLYGKQRYGINVFKVKEVVHCMNLTQIPERHPAVCGIAKIRELTVPVVDLSLAVKGPANSNSEKSYIIVTEYNNTIQGFLVSMVEKIVNLQWDQICLPPSGVGGGSGSYLSAVTNIDNEIIEILDVEKVLQEITPVDVEIMEALKPKDLSVNKGKLVVIIDDSIVARTQVVKTLQQTGVDIIAFKNGREALEALNLWVDTQDPRFARINTIICDIEMPEMDGYTFALAMKKRAEFKDLFIILHTSLSGSFNQALVEQVGANKFISKFDPNILAKTVMENLK